MIADSKSKQHSLTQPEVNSNSGGTNINPSSAHVDQSQKNEIQKTSSEGITREEVTLKYQNKLQLPFRNFSNEPDPDSPLTAKKQQLCELIQNLPNTQTSFLQNKIQEVSRQLDDSYQPTYLSLLKSAHRQMKCDKKPNESKMQAISRALQAILKALLCLLLAPFLLAALVVGGCCFLIGAPLYYLGKTLLSSSGDGLKTTLYWISGQQRVSILADLKGSDQPRIPSSSQELIEGQNKNNLLLTSFNSELSDVKHSQPPTPKPPSPLNSLNPGQKLTETTSSPILSENSLNAPFHLIQHSSSQAVVS